jgi:hypothetical protein
MENPVSGIWNGQPGISDLSKNKFHPFFWNPKEKRDEMAQRFVTIWFRHLLTDWFILRRPALSNVPFVLTTADHGRMIITAANQMARLSESNLGWWLQMPGGHSFIGGDR